MKAQLNQKNGESPMEINEDEKKIGERMTRRTRGETIRSRKNNKFFRRSHFLDYIRIQNKVRGESNYLSNPTLPETYFFRIN